MLDAAYLIRDSGLSASQMRVTGGDCVHGFRSGRISVAFSSRPVLHCRQIDGAVAGCYGTAGRSAFSNHKAADEAA